MRRRVPATSARCARPPGRPPARCREDDEEAADPGGAQGGGADARRRARVASVSGLGDVSADAVAQ
jgi:hypothetical protein